MNKTTKVCIIDGNRQYQALFIKMGMTVVLALEDADVVCFTGGEDVSPSFYGHPMHPATSSSLYRDEREKQAFEIARSKDIPMVGICRGAQFLNVMSGGTMYQDVDNHTRPHNLIDLETGEVVLVTSTHHQMMRPAKNAIIVATAAEQGNRIFWNGGNWVSEKSEEDYEVLMYAETNCLCFQPHPEMMLNNENFKPMYDYFDLLVNNYLLGD